jgi:predicted Zn-dependent peptidase
MIDNDKSLNLETNNIDSLSLEEVNAATKKYLRKDNFYLALVGTPEKPNVNW